MIDFRDITNALNDTLLQETKDGGIHVPRGRRENTDVLNTDLEHPFVDGTMRPRPRPHVLYTGLLAEWPTDLEISSANVSAKSAACTDATAAGMTFAGGVPTIDFRQTAGGDDSDDNGDDDGTDHESDDDADADDGEATMNPFAAAAAARGDANGSDNSDDSDPEPDPP